jgi:hypothetical protein
MPILIETTHPRKRRAPVWLLILAVVVLPLVGVFAWSCVQPVVLFDGTRGVAFWHLTEAQLSGFMHRPSNYSFFRGPNRGMNIFKLPGHETGYYLAGWAWR